MVVKVERCWAGGEKYYFLLTIPPNGSRERISGEKWTRETATEALDLLEKVYHFPRRNIRFYHA